MSTDGGTLLALRRRRGPFAFEDLRRRIGADLDDGTVASLLDISRQSVYRWRHSNRQMSADVADILATRAGFHPCEVWPDWWSWIDLEELP